MLLPSWINTAFGKVKPVRSSSESPWVNYNMWWWHSCVFWNQRGEVRVGHYKPLAFTTGYKRQWGQEASHRDQGAQSPAKNKQAPIVTSAGKYHWSLNSQVLKQREENASVQQAPERSQNSNYRDWQWSPFAVNAVDKKKSESANLLYRGGGKEIKIKLRLKEFKFTLNLSLPSFSSQTQVLESLRSKTFLSKVTRAGQTPQISTPSHQMSQLFPRLSLLE